MAAVSLKNILALDVGDARIGIATANTIAKLPSPLTILDNDSDIFDNLSDIIKEQKAEVVVVGLPRNMRGEETRQSQTVREFTDVLRGRTEAKLVFADETLTTKQAEEMYKDGHRRKPGEHLDDIAACFILDEYLRSNSDEI